MTDKTLQAKWLKSNSITQCNTPQPKLSTDDMERERKLLTAIRKPLLADFEQRSNEFRANPNARHQGTSPDPMTFNY